MKRILRRIAALVLSALTLWIVITTIESPDLAAAWQAVRLVEVSQLHFDRDFKNVFQQENDKVAEIANDMRTNGFDKSRPIIITEAYIIVDGYPRFMAAKKAGLEKVPVIIKKFDSRDETIEYEYKMQLNSR